MPRKRVAILGNGSSILDVPLNKIDCETIGLNRSWQLTNASHHIMTDSNQWGMYQQITGNPITELAKTTNLITGHRGPGSITFKTHQSHKPRWSMNPIWGVYMCGSVMYVALQLAVHYFGYEEIYLLGLDLYPKGASGKFWGGPWHPSIEMRQRETLAYASAILERELQITVYNVNPKSKCPSFPFRTFRECFGTE